MSDQLTAEADAVLKAGTATRFTAGHKVSMMS